MPKIPEAEWSTLFSGTPYVVRDEIRHYLESTPLEILKRNHFEAKNGFNLPNCWWSYEDTMMIVVPFLAKVQALEDRKVAHEASLAKRIAVAALAISFLGLLSSVVGLVF